MAISAYLANLRLGDQNLNLIFTDRFYNGVILGNENEILLAVFDLMPTLLNSSPNIQFLAFWRLIENNHSQNKDIQNKIDEILTKLDFSNPLLVSLRDLVKNNRTNCELIPIILQNLVDLSFTEVELQKALLYKLFSFAETNSTLDNWRLLFDSLTKMKMLSPETEYVVIELIKKSIVKMDLATRMELAGKLGDFNFIYPANQRRLATLLTSADLGSEKEIQLKLLESIGKVNFSDEESQHQIVLAIAKATNFDDTRLAGGELGLLCANHTSFEAIFSLLENSIIKYLPQINISAPDEQLLMARLAYNIIRYARNHRAITNTDDNAKGRHRLELKRLFSNWVVNEETYTRILAIGPDVGELLANHIQLGSFWINYDLVIDIPENKVTNANGGVAPLDKTNLHGIYLEWEQDAKVYSPRLFIDKKDCFYCLANVGTHGIIYDNEGNPKYLAIIYNSKTGNISGQDINGTLAKELHTIAGMTLTRLVIESHMISLKLKLYLLVNPDEDYPALIDNISSSAVFADLPLWLQNYIQATDKLDYTKYEAGCLLEFILNLCNADDKGLTKPHENGNKPQGLFSEEIIADYQKAVEVLVKSEGSIFYLEQNKSEDAKRKDRINDAFKSVDIRLFKKRLKNFWAQLPDYRDKLWLAYLFGELAKRGALGYHIDENVDASNKANDVLYYLCICCVNMFLSEVEAGKVIVDAEGKKALKDALDYLQKGDCIEWIMNKLRDNPNLSQFNLSQVWKQVG